MVTLVNARSLLSTGDNRISTGLQQMTGTRTATRCGPSPSIRRSGCPSRRSFNNEQICLASRVAATPQEEPTPSTACRYVHPQTGTYLQQIFRLFTVCLRCPDHYKPCRFEMLPTLLYACSEMVGWNLSITLHFVFMCSHVVTIIFEGGGG
jgi:hypothetical protein